MDKQEMIELAERVESLTGPCRETDALIAGLTGAEHGSRETVGYDSRGVLYFDEVAEPYTASLDAAMTLVPEGLSWTLGQNVHHKHWVCSVNYLDQDGAPACRAEGCSKISAATALTAVALRAIAGETE